jgi:formamidopyrimidine-DNA glycosylase
VSAVSVEAGSDGAEGAAPAESVPEDWASATGAPKASADQSNAAHKEGTKRGAGIAANRFLAGGRRPGELGILGYSRRSHNPLHRRNNPVPELPEVETTRRGVAPHVERQKVTAVRIYDHRLRWPVPRDLPRRLVGRKIDRVDRRSKYLLFRVGADTLLVHMGMTGSLRIFTRPPPKEAHDHVDLEFANGVVLRYRDPRRFGAMLWSPGAATEHRLLARLGVEPLGPEFDADYLHRAMRARRAAIKLVLMDSHVVVGVGNIYANESLFRAGIRPERAAHRIGRDRLGRLAQAVRETLAEAIAKGGSTLRDYVDSRGEPGYFQLHYCGTHIRMRRLGARATYYCVRCQR